MNVIFLDIDGVLNNEVFVNAFWAICKQLELNRKAANYLKSAVIRDEYGMLFCPTAVNQLEWLIESTQAKIVISSTWRMSGLAVMQEMWKHRNLPGEVIDITPFHPKRERGEEIAAWLSVNPVDRYIIIDDDNDMLPEQLPYFVQTDFRYGLTFDDAIKALNIFNKELTIKETINK